MNYQWTTLNVNPKISNTKVLQFSLRISCHYDIACAFQNPYCTPGIDHFTVVCLVTWPLNGSEAGGDLVLIQTLLLLLCKSSCSDII